MKIGICLWTETLNFRKEHRTMRINQEVIEKIERAKIDRVKKSGYKVGLGINLADNVCAETNVYRDGNYICELQELSQIIFELEAIKDAISDTMGLNV